MKLIKPPKEPDFSEEIPKLVFLAGGITGAPDWQEEFYDLVYDRIPDTYTLINPRRENFDVRDPSMSDEQIRWECKWLQRSSKIVFWFPEETLCPITLFELGKELGLRMGPFPRKDMIIGIHPFYQRRVDVETQTSLVDEDIDIFYGLRGLAEGLIAQCHSDVV